MMLCGTDAGLSASEEETRHIGPYVLLQRLGRGGMGHVYKAEHRLMKRVVALKVAGCADAAAELRFRREVEAAGRLRHPSIVTAYDAGVWRGRLYLAMEYVDGIDLECLVAASGPLTVDLACAIVRQTAEALHHAHERGLVHRDIKPSNIMLAPPGITVKLLDLGLAQLTDPASSVEDEELCGTPDFMAPEWGRDLRRADVRGDLYSLGCTFYFLLSGQVPYPGGNGREKLLRHSLDEPAPLRPDVPPQVAAIVERLMARDVERRYATAAAVAADLAAIHFAPLAMPKEEIIITATPSAARTISSPRNKRFSCFALAAILLGVAAAGGARWMTTPPRTPADKSGSAFTITGRADGFSSLAKAIAAASDGDIIEIHGSASCETAPLSWQGKALTLRAGSDVSPRLTLKGGDPWQALLQTDRPLTLQGLELYAGAEAATPLIRSQQAAVYLTNCRLNGGADGTAIIARRPSEVSIRGCEIDAGAVGLSVEVGQTPCRLLLSDCRLRMHQDSAAALSLWGTEERSGGPVEVELQGNTIQAGRLAALRALPANLTITAHENRLIYGSALLSYSAFVQRDAWRDTVWQGGGNSYEGPASWLWVEGRPVAVSEKPALR
jgi:serine/threonine protein kinase